MVFLKQKQTDPGSCKDRAITGSFIVFKKEGKSVLRETSQRSPEKQRADAI